jgi:hemerythrin-like domain-containing protein
VDAIDFIIEDHERFRDALGRYEELDDDATDDKRTLVDELIADCTRHGSMEEHAFYPFVLDRVPDVEEDIREEIEEHHVLELIMRELAEHPADDPQFDAKVEVFAENLLHHLEEEEEELFPVLRQHLSSETLEALTDDLRTARDRASGEPDPSRQERTAPGPDR